MCSVGAGCGLPGGACRLRPCALNSLTLPLPPRPQACCLATASLTRRAPMGWRWWSATPRPSPPTPWPSTCPRCAGAPRLACSPARALRGPASALRHLRAACLASLHQVAAARADRLLPPQSVRRSLASGGDEFAALDAFAGDVTRLAYDEGERGLAWGSQGTAANG